MKYKKNQTNSSTEGQHGQHPATQQDDQQQQQAASRTSLIEVLEDVHAKIMTIRPGSPDEEQIKAAATWAIQCLHRSAYIAKTPGLKSALYWMEKGCEDVGKAAFPNQ